MVEGCTVGAGAWQCKPKELSFEQSSAFAGREPEGLSRQPRPLDAGLDRHRGMDGHRSQHSILPGGIDLQAPACAHPLEGAVCPPGLRERRQQMDKSGVGLGLYLVKAIINSHDEDIAVKSENGETEFVFTLPLAE